MILSIYVKQLQTYASMVFCITHYLANLNIGYPGLPQKHTPNISRTLRLTGCLKLIINQQMNDIDLFIRFYLNKEATLFI